MNHITSTSPDLLDFLDIVDSSTNRHWPIEAVNRLVTSRVHGSYSWTDTRNHLGLRYTNLVDISTDELQRFWREEAILPSIVDRWSSKAPEDTEVKEVLRDIQAVLDELKTFEANIEASFKTAE